MRMYRDIWTLFVPGFLAGAVVIAVGVALDWSNAALGWALIGSGLLVIAVWQLSRPHPRGKQRG
jgi:hypothetical protein